MAFPAIQSFKNAMIDGGQRPSLFQMELTTFPTALLGTDRIAPFFIKIAEIPPAIMNPIVVKYAGREVKYATQRQYQPITVTIINDEGFRIRRWLELWFDYMNDPELNTATFVSNLTGVSAPGLRGGASYAGTGEIIQYSKTGAKLRAYKLQDMFPSNIGSIQLSWDNEAAIGEYTCEFQYQYWRSFDFI